MFQTETLINHSQFGTNWTGSGHQLVSGHAPPTWINPCETTDETLSSAEVK